MAAFEKQHFLPASYLKFFSDDPNKMDRGSFVWRVDKTTQRRVPVASQCHEKHFYSKEKAQEAEQYFQTREVIYNRIICQLMDGHVPEGKNLGDLFLCMFDIHLRNAAHENQAGEEGFSAYMDRLNLFIGELLIQGKPGGATHHNTKMHIQENWRMEIIHAANNEMFITSDHPALVMTCTGTPTPRRALQMIILPLTPIHTAIAFDRRIMWLENKVPTQKDMETLNIWQIRNSVNCIYANRELEPQEVTACQSHLQNKLNQSSVMDEHGWRLHTAALPENAHFSFMKLKPLAL